MQYAENILGTMGGTPLVKLNRVTKRLMRWCKVETFNPGNSTKDRMAMKMIDDAEADRLQPEEL
jgi:cystathionine beta-synthase